MPTKSLSTERAGHSMSSGEGHRGYTKFPLLAFAFANSAECGLACEKGLALSAGHQAVYPFRLLTTLLGLQKLYVHFVKTSLSKNGNFVLLFFH